MMKNHKEENFYFEVFSRKLKKIKKTQEKIVAIVKNEVHFKLLILNHFVLLLTIIIFVKKKKSSCLFAFVREKIENENEERKRKTIIMLELGPKKLNQYRDKKKSQHNNNRINNLDSC